MADKYESKDMTGALFVNKDKKTENHPDRSGTIKVHGVEYRLSGWIKKSKNGDSYMSLSVSEPKEKSGGHSGGYSSNDGDEF
jgi:uncharacterized protein (DUF736 family)